MTVNPKSILLCLDPGTTDSKIIYRILDNQFALSKLLLISSATTEVSKDEIESYESNRFTDLLPENEAWVKYDGQLFATGFLAKKFHAVANKNNLKYEDAITKVLATVGVIASKEKLDSNLELFLSVPLPYSEWKDKDKIERELESALSSFSFRGRQFSVNLNYFRCFPESGGLMLNRSKKLKSKFSSGKITSVMFGYRDLSMVVSERGKPEGVTEKLGFVNMIESVQKLTSGLEKEELLKVLNKAGANIKPNYFRHLAQSNSKSRRAGEIAEILDAVKSARSQYWQKVSRWLTASLPIDSDEVIIGGGTAYYLHNELKDFFSQDYPDLPICWFGDLEKEVISAFGIEKENRSLAVRLADAYGLFMFMEQQLGKSKPKNKEPGKEVHLVS